MGALLSQVRQVWQDTQPAGAPPVTWSAIARDLALGSLVAVVVFVDLIGIAVIGAWR